MPARRRISQSQKRIAELKEKRAEYKGKKEAVLAEHNRNINEIREKMEELNEKKRKLNLEGNTYFKAQMSAASSKRKKAKAQKKFTANAIEWILLVRKVKKLSKELKFVRSAKKRGGGVRSAELKREIGKINVEIRKHQEMIDAEEKRAREEAAAKEQKKIIKGEKRKAKEEYFKLSRQLTELQARVEGFGPEFRLAVSYLNDARFAEVEKIIDAIKKKRMEQEERRRREEAERKAKKHIKKEEKRAVKRAKRAELQRVGSILLSAMNKGRLEPRYFWVLYNRFKSGKYKSFEEFEKALLEHEKKKKK